MITKTIREFAEHGKLRKNVREGFQAAGYYPVELSGPVLMGEWQECHQWCCEHIGEDHYSWTGGTFWFETEKAAMWFALRWS
jgi:hypothetical protein